MMMRHYANDTGHYIGGYFEPSPFPGAREVTSLPPRLDWLWNGKAWVEPVPRPIAVSTVSGVSDAPTVVVVENPLSAQIEQRIAALEKTFETIAESVSQIAPNQKP